MNGDYYQIIGVKRDATFDVIKKAYHEKVRRYHPDINHSQAAAEQFLEIQTAYEVLRDPEKRMHYDEQLEQEQYAQPVTRIRTVPSRKVIPRLAEEQLAYALVEIECLKMDSESSTPKVHLCLVIDQSTSMQGPRLEMVKANIDLLLNKMNETDLISVITFSDEAEVFLPPTQIKNKSFIKSKITQISTSGGTEIRKGLEAGIGVLWQGHNEGYTRYLILLTDGHTYGDEEACLKLARKAADQGIVINALGIGNGWNADFLEKLSAISGGTTILIKSKEGLSRFLERTINNIEIVYAQKMCLFVEPDPRVEMRYLFQLDPNIIQYDVTDNQIMLGDLYYGKKSVFLAEFLIHPLIKKDKDVELLTGQIKMELLHEKRPNARIFLRLNLPVVDNFPDECPPEEIVRAISRITLYSMQERSREDVRIGRFENATRRLNHLASRLMSEGEIGLATRILAESTTIESSHQFSQDGEKEIKYGTKSLLALPSPEQGSHL